MALSLYGYHYSVYCWITRMVLAEKSLSADWVEINPFAPSAGARNPHPFNRVPLLTHEGLELYETRAICQYLDDEFGTPGELQPTSARDRARMQQIISMIDQYVYPNLVRGVFELQVVAIKWRLPAEPERLRRAISDSNTALGALEQLVDSDCQLVGAKPTLGDMHLAPMLALFTQAPAGQNLLADYPALAAWWAQWQQRPSLVATDPGDMPAA